MRRMIFDVAAVALIALAVSGCRPSSAQAPDAAGEAKTDSARIDPMVVRGSDEPDIGLVTYERYCSGCHGAAGDGNGPAARFLFPPPRNFVKGLYKFTTTPSGSLPTDDDLIRTITHGLRGTAMPAFPLLSEAEKRGLVRHLKLFYPDWNSYPPAPTITRHSNPFDLDPEFPEEKEEAIRLGEEIYHGRTTCWNCHPQYVEGERAAEISKKYDGRDVGRPDGDKPILKKDDWGYEIPPPDFKTMQMKSIRNLEDLYRVIAAGVGGTAMPSWQDSLDANEAWALTLYVESLVEKGRAERRARRAGGRTR